MNTSVQSSLVLCATLELLETSGWSKEHKFQFHRDEQRSSNLLSALQEACNYDLDLYKSMVVYLARKVDPIFGRLTTWPIAALELANWETQECRTFDDIRNLLST